MDKFITLDEAEAKLQSFTKFDIFYAAIDSRINIYWSPNNTFGIEIVKVELFKTIDLNDVECERWRPVKGSPVVEHQFGPFLIDAVIDDRWPMILGQIKDKHCVSAIILLYDDPLRFKDLDGRVYAAYFYDPHDYVLPKPNELSIRTSELKDIKKTLTAIRDGSTTRGKITYARQDFIKEYLDKHNLWHRLNEVQHKRGESTFKSELWGKENFREKKDENGKFIFANLSSSKLNVQNFYDAIKVVINNNLKK